MKRLLLLVPAVALALLSDDCAAQSPPTPPPSSVSAAQAPPSIPSTPPCDITAKVFLPPAGGASFANNFMPNGSYTRPMPTTHASAGVRQDIQAVFSISPLYLQQELCGLNFILIDDSPGAPYGYAFWEGKNQGDGTGHWIGLSPGVWTDQLSLIAYQSAILQDLLNIGSRTGYQGSYTPKYISAATTGTLPIDDWHYALLAIIAHEMGHWLWHSKCSDGQDRVCDANFSRGGWGKIGDVPSLHDFGRPFARSKHAGGTPNYYEILDDFHVRTDATKLRRIFGRDHNFLPLPAQLIIYPTFFGSLAIDEDFAETYKLMVLNDSNVISLVVELTDDVRDVADVMVNLTYPSSTLLQKAQFIRQNLLP